MTKNNDIVLNQKHTIAGMYLENNRSLFERYNLIPIFSHILI